MPRGRSRSIMAAAQRTPRVGPGGNEPSPNVFSSWPRKRTSSCRTIEWCWSSRASQLRSPSATACFVDPTISVNSAVASNRSGSARARDPVRNNFDLFDQTVAVAGERRVVDAAEFEVLCPRNVLREVATSGHLHDRVAVPVQHQCGHPDCRQDRAHVDLSIHSQKIDRCSRACAHPLKDEQQSMRARIASASRPRNVIGTGITSSSLLPRCQSRPRPRGSANRLVQSAAATGIALLDTAAVSVM